MACGLLPSSIEALASKALKRREANTNWLVAATTNQNRAAASKAVTARKGNSRGWVIAAVLMVALLMRDGIPSAGASVWFAVAAQPHGGGEACRGDGQAEPEPGGRQEPNRSDVRQRVHGQAVRRGEGFRAATREE